MQTRRQHDVCERTGGIGADNGLREPPIVSNVDLNQRPHEIFRQLRSVVPLIRREDGGYIVVRACDVERLVTDPRTRQSEVELPVSRGVTEGPLYDFFRDSMLFTNGHHHRRRRAPLSRAFGVKVVEDLRPQIRSAAEGLLDRLHGRGEMNLLTDYAARIPALVIAAILGIPEGDIPRFTGLVYRMARAITPSFALEDVSDTVDAARQLSEYAGELLARRRAEPREDFLTAYLRDTDAAGNLSAAEVLNQIVTIIIAGSDTTRAALTIQTGLLLEHREQWDAICADTSLIPGAVCESLRYEPAVGSIPRVTVEDIELEGYVVPRNRMLTLSTLSAMRDPAVHFDPDRFDICRTDLPRKHIVFGAGPHRCLGEALAKAELEEGMAALVVRMPQLQLAGDPLKVRGYGGIRTVPDLLVRW